MIINLTEGFMPFGDSSEYNKLGGFDTFTFPSGVETHFKLNQILSPNGTYRRTQIDRYLLDVVFTIRLTSAKDIMLLLLATDAIRRCSEYISVGVFFPYVPYARQDRVMVEGEPLSIKVFADLINSQNYQWVGFYDVHSDVTTAIINNSYNFTNKGLWESALTDAWRQSNSTDRALEYYVCSPDAGASKKIGKLVESVRPLPIDIIQCNKTRDLSTGKITGLTVSHSDLGGKDVYIVDDICSKGGTFMMIAKKLRELNAGKIYLVVSHWEDSADLSKLSKAGIEFVYTTNSMGRLNTTSAVKFDTSSPDGFDLVEFIKQYKLEDIL